MEQPCAPPTLPGPPDAAGEWHETLRYRVFPRPKSKFKTTIDPKALFGPTQESTVRVKTRRAAAEVELNISIDLAGSTLTDRLLLDLQPGMVARHLHRQVIGPEGQVVRDHQVAFREPPYPLPLTTYPEVMSPFLMRGQPKDKTRRSLYCWTNDGFCARVYYEWRGQKNVTLRDGRRTKAHEIWMYPDLNDWISMGAALTRLAKPLLPRYTMWFEPDELQRLLRFEGPYGPPGAPEVVVELMGEA